MIFSGCFSVLFASVCLKVVNGAPQLGGELSYSPMQVIQAPTSAVAPALSSAQNIPRDIPRVVPPAGALADQTSPNLNQASIQVIQRTTAATAPALSSAQNIPRDIPRVVPPAGGQAAQTSQNLNQASMQVIQRTTSATAPALNYAQNIHLAGAVPVSPASGQVNTQAIQGSTSGIASVLNLAQNMPQMITQAVPLVGAIPGSPFSAANQNFQRVLVRSGLNILGEGAKAGATIPTIPVRVMGAGLDEFRKAAVSRLGSTNSSQPMDIKTKIVSNVLNTVSSQLAQANLGGQMLEEALKNRVKDMASKIAEIVVPNTSQTAQITNTLSRSSGGLEALPVTNKVVDTLLDQFNTAVRRNDLMLMQALKAVIARVEPQKNST